MADPYELSERARSILSREANEQPTIARSGVAKRIQRILEKGRCAKQGR